MPAMLEEKKERRKRKKEKSTAASKSVKSCEPRDEALHAQKGNPTPLPTVAPHDLCPPPEKLRRLNSSSLVIHFLLSVSRSAISYLQFYLMTPPFRRRVNNRPQQQRLRWLESPKKLTASPKIKGISVYPVLTITIAATLAIYGKPLRRIESPPIQADRFQALTIKCSPSKSHARITHPCLQHRLNLDSCRSRGCLCDFSPLGGTEGFGSL